MTGDFFIQDELDKLPAATVRRHIGEVEAMVAELARTPVEWRNPTFEIQRRSMLARFDGDVTVDAWLAWLRSHLLLAEVKAIFAGEADG